MKYSDWKSFEKHLMNATSYPSSVYLLFNRDDFFFYIAENCLIKIFSKDRQVLRWDCSEISDRVVEAELLELDLFAVSKIIYLEFCEKLSKKGMEILQHYYLKPQKNIILMMSTSTLNANTNFYKNTEKYGVVFSPEALRSREQEDFCKEWLAKESTKENKILTTKAAELLYQSVGFNYVSLKNELEKLILYVGNEKTITEENVSNLVYAAPQATTWQVSDAILQGNLPLALHYSHLVLNEGSSLIGFIRQLRKPLQTGFELCSAVSQSGNTESFTKKYPYMKGFILEKNIKLARQYGMERFKNALIALDATEFSAKDSVSDEEILLDMLITTLVLGLDIHGKKTT